MSILDALVKPNTNTPKARSEYAAILRRELSGAPHKTDGVRIAAVCDALGKSAADVSADLEVLRKVAALESANASPTDDQLEAERWAHSKDAGKLSAEMADKLEAFRAQLIAEQYAAANIRDVSESKVNDRKRARAQIANLRTQHAELFAE